jgi:hypothetical protein
MKSDSNQEKAWFELFCRAADDRLSPEEFERLSRLLRKSEKARRRWFEFRDLECGLSVLPESKGPPKNLAHKADSHPEEASRGGFSPGWMNRRWILGGAAAATLAFGVWSGWNDFGPETDFGVRASSDGMARLGAVSGAIWGSPDLSFKEGDRVPSRRPLELLAGSAELRFRSGAVATLYAPCIFEVTSGNSGFLTYGKLKAKATTAASKGFTVQTPTARLVDMGTEFLAASSEDGQSRVEVLSGEVRVHLPSQDESHRLNEGQAWTLPSENQRVIVKIENGDGTEEFRLPSIERPSQRSYSSFADGAASGRIWGAADVEDTPNARQLELRSQERGSLLADLGHLVSVTKVNAYTWKRPELKAGDRPDSKQRFALYAAASEVPPSTSVPLEKSGWKFIGRVNSDSYFGVDAHEDRPEQQAVSFTATSGCLGRYRYLLWVPLGSPSESLAQNSGFLGDFDVYTVR